MALTVTEIQQLYTAYLNRSADQEGLDYWQDLDVSIETVRQNLASDSQDEYRELYGNQSRAEVVESIYQNMFGRSADAEGLDYWVDGDGASVPADQLQQLFISAASTTDRAAFNAKVAEQEADIDTGTTEPEPTNPGESYVLTEGRDALTGTANDDTFIGDVGQNQNGAISNALSTGDRLDGAGGRNTLEATLINDNEVDSGLTQAPRPITQNIQEVYIEALEGNTSVEDQVGGSNGSPMYGHGNATLDATRMQNVEQYWSDFSRGDMTFSGVNLNGNNLNITKDVTFGMRDVDFDSGLRAAFETQSLVRAPETQLNSQLQVRIADVSTETPTTPLANVDLNLSFDIGGETVTLNGIRSTDGTYAGLVEALRAELTDAGQGDINVALSNPYEQVTVAGNTVTLPFTAQEILLTDADGSEFSNVNFTQAAIESVPDGFLVAGNAQPVDPAVASNLIESNLILDNAGRGSTAGDAIIGGMSNSGAVVEKLNLEVDRGSKIGNLLTASGMGHTRFNAGVEDQVAFEQIEVTSGDAQGDLSVANVGNVYNFDATAFEGANLSVAGQAGVRRTADGDWEPNAEAEAHVYNTANDAGSADTIDVTYSHNKAAEFNGFSLAINTGEGDDTVHTNAVDAAGNNLANQQDLQQNVNINAGNGDNTVWTEGAGGVTITTGSGEDAIYSDNSGASVMTGADNAATWLVNAANTDFNDIRGTAAGLSSGLTTTGGAGNAIPAVLAGANLTVTLAGASTGGAVTSAASSAFNNGFEGFINLNDVLGDRVFGDQTDVNTAIMQVINNHKVLSKLLVAENGPDNSLVIRSQIDGTFSADDLQITLTPANASNLGQSDQDRLVNAIREESNDSGYDGSNLQAVLDGSTSAVHSNMNGIGTGGGVQADDGTAALAGSASTADNTGNMINAGGGQDVIVLSTNDVSNETVVFDGSFGNNTIVNFDADSTSTGADTLDFTAYLTNEQFQGGSTSAESRDAFATTGVNGGGSIGANSVITLNDFAAGTGNNSGQTWTNMTADNLLSAIQNGNNTADYGNLTSSTLDVNGTISDLVGNSIDAVVMVENDNNAGQYKVFSLTGNGVNDADTANEFSNAELIGTVDFGNTVDASAVNFA